MLSDSSIVWCFKQKRGIRIIEPNPILTKAYLKKAQRALSGRGDTVIMKKLELPDVEKEWEDIFKMMDEKGLKLSLM